MTTKLLKIGRTQLGGLALRVAVSAAVIGYLSAHVDWPHIVAAFRGLRWGWWLGGVALYVVCQLLCCVRWMWLSRPMGFTQSAGQFTSIYFIGMFFNLFLPTSVGGDAVRAVYLANGSGRRTAAVLSVLLDRLSGLLVLIGLACVATVASPVELPAQLKWTVGSVGGAALVGLAILPVFCNYSARIAGRFPRTRSGLESIADAVAMFRRRPGMLAGTTCLSVLVQILNAILVAMLGLALSLDVPLVYYGVAAPMVTLFTLIPISLNGVGLREGGMVLFLGPAGVGSADAVTLAFLWFLVQSATSLMGAVVYMFGRPGAAEVGGEALSDYPAQGRASEHRAAA